MKTIRQKFLNDMRARHHAGSRIASALSQLDKQTISTALRNELSVMAKEAGVHAAKIGEVVRCFGAPDAFKERADRVALIGALENAGHHEIASLHLQHDWEVVSYGCLLDWAHRLSDPAAADFLEAVLDEETTAAAKSPAAVLERRHLMRKPAWS